MGKFNNYFLPLSFITLCLAFWNRNDFPQQLALLPELQQPPKQHIVHKEALSTVFKDVDYKVQPMYEYDLYGLVVSFRHHDGDSMLHKAWNDHLNSADICVVWKDSANTSYLNQLKFWNGQFTCNVKTSDQRAWNSFNMNQLSNNHLISDNKLIRKSISKVKVGDQIRVQGWLSSYKSDMGGTRGTSITRNDTGNGACETIYVENFQILRSMDNGWRQLMYISLLLFLVSLLVYFTSPYEAKY